MQFGITTTIRNFIARNTAFEQLLLGDLRDILEDPIDLDTRDWLLAVLDALLRLIPLEICSEQAGGYLEEVLEEYPSWERQVQDLKQKHLALYLQLRELRAEVAKPKFAQCISRSSHRKLHEWIEAVHHHNQQETALLQTAINLEVGVGD